MENYMRRIPRTQFQDEKPVLKVRHWACQNPAQILPLAVTERQVQHLSSRTVQKKVVSEHRDLRHGQLASGLSLAISPCPSCNVSQFPRGAEFVPVGDDCWKSPF
jgi:hypothetical protein